MTLSRSKIIRRAVAMLSAAVVGTCIALASTLPGPIPSNGVATLDIAPSSLLPKLMDASSSYADTGNSSPAATVTVTAPVARVSSGPLSLGVSTDGLDALPDHGGCVPEPVSLVLMSTGILGLLGVRILRRS